MISCSFNVLLLNVKIMFDDVFIKMLVMLYLLKADVIRNKCVSCCLSVCSGSHWRQWAWLPTKQSIPALGGGGGCVVRYSSVLKLALSPSHPLLLPHPVLFLLFRSGSLHEGLFSCSHWNSYFPTFYLQLNWNSCSGTRWMSSAAGSAWQQRVWTVCLSVMSLFSPYLSSIP